MGFFNKVLHLGEGRKLKALEGIIPEVGAFEPEIQKLSDDQLAAKTAQGIAHFAEQLALAVRRLAALALVGGIARELAALTEGQLAGIVAVGGEGTASSRRLEHERDSWREFGALLATSFSPRDELRELADADTIICRCEDVPLGRLDPSWTSRQAKLYTRAGMGPCQGGVCGPACHFLFGWEPGRVDVLLTGPTSAGMSSERIAFVRATDLRVNAAVGVRASGSLLDLAATRIVARERALELPRPSWVYFSVSEIDAPDYQGDAHLAWPVTMTPRR